MLERIEQYIEDYHLLRREDPLIAAVSGGADSLCLLEVLHRLDYQVTAVHVQHHLRESAEHDAAFTKAFAEARGIPFVRKDVDVASRVQKTGESMEEAARALRYEALEEERALLEEKAGRPAVIATAHHKNDQAETVLFHLVRGSGVRGLSGMRPRRGNIVRPLLSVTREEIEAFLTAEGISWCTDETNLDPAMTRNRIRKIVIPALSSIRTDAVEKIAETAEFMAETDDYLRRLANAWLSANAREAGKDGLVHLPLNLKKEEAILQRYVLREALRNAGISLKDVTKAHVEGLLSLFEKPVGKVIALPHGTEAERTYRAVVVRRTGERKPTKDAGTPSSMEIRVFPREKNQNLPEKECTKWFDYDRIKGNVSLRFRKPGDVFSTREGSHKKLKDWMIDEKIPKALRDGIEVVADGEEVLWVPGFRRGESKKITEQTKTILEITVHRGPGKE